MKYDVLTKVPLFLTSGFQFNRVLIFVMPIQTFGKVLNIEGRWQSWLGTGTSFNSKLNICNDLEHKVQMTHDLVTQAGITSGCMTRHDMA